MSTLDGAALLPAIVQAPRGPRSIILSFYLWWIVIALQSIYLAYAGLTFAEAARIGGPAWDILFDFGIPVLVVLTLTALQVTFVFLMRQGIRGSRVVLIVIAAVMWPVDYLLAAQVWRILSATSAVLSGPIILTAVIVTAAAAAIVAMYLPVSNAFFRSRRSAMGQVAAVHLDEPSPSTSSPRTDHLTGADSDDVDALITGPAEPVKGSEQ